MLGDRPRCSFASNVRGDRGRTIDAGAAVEENRLRELIECFESQSANLRTLLLDLVTIGSAVMRILPRDAPHLKALIAVTLDQIRSAQVETGIVGQFLVVHEAEGCS